MSLRRGEQDPDKRPPSSPGFSSGLVSMCPVRRGQASEVASFPSSLEGYIPRCLPLLDGECETGGKTYEAASPSACCSGLCPGAKQSIQMGFVSSGHTGPRYWNHHQRVMDGDQNRDFVSRKRLGGVLTAAGAGTCPGRAPFCWNRASGRV